MWSSSCYKRNSLFVKYANGQQGPIGKAPLQVPTTSVPYQWRAPPPFFSLIAHSMSTWHSLAYFRNGEFLLRQYELYIYKCMSVSVDSTPTRCCGYFHYEKSSCILNLHKRYLVWWKLAKALLILLMITSKWLTSYECRNALTVPLSCYCNEPSVSSVCANN